MTGNETVLVTGATGFTGGALAKELVRRGRHVRALVRPTGNVAALLDAGVELIEGDIRNPDDVARAVEHCAVVYHIAAAFRAAGQPDSYYHDVNVRGVENVIEAARLHRTPRVVHCSTVGVHGHVRDIPSHEDSPYNPGDIYQETKLDGEKVAQRAIAEGLPVTIFRPAGIYGPGDLRFLKLFRAIRNRRFRMFGSGETFYHFTYIDDLVDGIILCGEHPRAGGRIYVLCGNDYVTLNKLVGVIAEAVNVKPPRGRLPLWPLLAAARVCELACKPLGIDPPLHTRRAEFFIKDRAFTNARVRRELGFAPKVDTAEGMRRTGKWYFEQGLLKS